MPWPMDWRVMIEKKISTMFSQELLGRGGVQLDPGSSPAGFDVRVFVAGVVVADDVQLSCAVGLGDLFEETPGGGVGACARRQPCRWRLRVRQTAVGGAVSAVVVAAFLRVSGRGRIGAVPSRARICASHRPTTRSALSGGFRYNPTTSRTLASSSGSVENLNDSVRHGCRPHLSRSRPPTHD